MAVSNINPASGATLAPAESFSFEVTDPYTSLLVRVTVGGGVLEAAYDDAAATGYSVSIEDLGATHRVTVTRDAGWNDDPMKVYVLESGTTATDWTYDVYPTQSYPEGMRPYNDSTGGTTTGVITFEGRSGNVVATAGDYAAGLITNDSSVTGAFVDDALDNLAADIAAIPAAPVDSVHGRTGAVVSVKGDYTSDEVTIQRQGAPDLDTIQELIDRHVGVGIIAGGEVTDNGDGTASVGGGSGMLRADDVDTGTVYSIQWSPNAALALTDNVINYVYVEYNAGTPQIAVSTTLPTDLNSNLLLAGVHRAGTFLHPTPYRYQQNNLSYQVNRRLYNVDGTTHSSGAAISEENTREIRVEAGTFYLGLNEALFASHNSNTDGCAYYYRDGVGGWTVVYPSPAIDNLQYDDGSGTLATLGTGRYGVHWVYVSPHDQHMYFVYGEGNYTKSQAQAAIAPSTLPPQIDEWHGVLAGKVTVLKSATNLFSVESAFIKLFLSGGVDAHGDLTGLTDDDHTQYSRADGTRDLDALFLVERPDHVNTPTIGKSELWLNSAINPPRLMFTNENGVDGTVVVHRSGGPGNNAILTGYGTEGTVDSSTLFTYNSGNGELANAQWPGGPLRLKEGLAISVGPTALFGSVWVKDDSPNRLHYTDGDGGDNTLAYLAELNDGTVDHGALTGLADDDHTLYALVDGTRAFTGPIEIDSATAGLTVGEHSSSMGTPAAGKVAVYAKADGLMYSKDDAGVETLMSGGSGGGGSYVTTDGTTEQEAVLLNANTMATNFPTLSQGELWCRNANTYNEPVWTDAIEWDILRSYQPATYEIPFWNVSAAGNFCTVDDNFKYINGVDELILGGAPALSLAERNSKPAAGTAAGKLYARSDYQEPIIMHNALDADGHDPTWLAPDGTETNLAWQERNLPISMGATMWHKTSAAINGPIGGTNKTTSDANVSFIYDDLSNHWYNSWLDASLGDYILCDSADGITWSSRKVLDTSTTSGDMSWVATTGTVCGAACDGYFYRSTDLTVANLAFNSSVPSATESTMLFWHGVSNVWVHVGYSGSTSYVHTAPDSAGTMTWTQRWTSASYGLLVAGDIQRDPEGISKSALDYPDRICLWSATNSAMVYCSTSTAFTWSVDTGGQPTTGLNVAHWCPALGSQYANLGAGGWMGIDSTGAIWYCAQSSGGTWLKTTYSGGTLWKTPTFQGWCNAAGTASNTTVYSVHSVDNGNADCQHYSLVGYMRGGHSMLSDSDSLLNRGVYRWGNGVTVYDRWYDAQTIVGRYGPIRL